MLRILALLIGAVALPFAASAEEAWKFQEDVDRLIELHGTGGQSHIQGQRRDIAAMEAYFNPSDLQRVKDSAFSAMISECASGVANICGVLAVIMGRSKDAKPKEISAALAAFRKSCARKVPDACFALGFWQELGLGTKANQTEANVSYEKSCDLKFSPACNALGDYYLNKDNPKRDSSRALSYYQKACDMGLGSGCEEAGFLYYTGEGVPKDRVRSLPLFERACKANEAMSCALAGGQYLAGEGTKTNVDKAIAFYEKGCDGDVAISCVLAGQGKRARKDEPAAVKYFKKACELGEKKGCDLLKAK